MQLVEVGREQDLAAVGRLKDIALGPTGQIDDVLIVIVAHVAVGLITSHGIVSLKVLELAVSVALDLPALWLARASRVHEGVHTRVSRHRWVVP